MEAALGLMRRMPPKHAETALSALLSLLPHHSSDLLSQVDQPLQTLHDVDSGKEFILCEYNRDADSYRLLNLDSGSLIVTGRTWLACTNEAVPSTLVN